MNFTVCVAVALWLRYQGCFPLKNSTYQGSIIAGEGGDGGLGRKAMNEIEFQ